jgi:TonB-linked SusC/RagA family outer membrane protein
MKRKLVLMFLCIFCFIVHSLAQQKLISGLVTDENAQLLPGVTVVVKGTTTGTVTGPDGKFSINVPSDAVLTISFIGFKTVEIPVKGKTNLAVALQEDKKLIDEVVIVGYGTQKKVNLTGAVSTVDVTKTIGSRPVTDLARGLQGSSPGLLITSSSGNIGLSPEIHIRGMQGSVNAEAKPLILLDNVEIPNLMMVNPSDIESVSVLKDAASASIYGARGSWGVILLTSKKGAHGRMNVSYDNSFAWSSPVNTPEIADGADGAEYMLKQYRRTAPNTQTFNILGAYYDDLSIERMRQWKKLYGGMELGNEMVEGRDFERRNGQVYYYRPWDIDNLFLSSATPMMKHNLSVSGGNNKTTYFASFGILDQKGLVKITPEPDKYRRLSGSMRIESKINDWFTARGSLMVSTSSKKYPNFRLTNGNAKNEYWFNVYRYPETYPYGTFNGLPLKNIRTELEQAHMNSDQEDFGRLQIGTTITFLKGWTADVDYTYSMNNSHDKVATSPITGLNSWVDPTLSVVVGNYFPAEDYVRHRAAWNNRNVGKAYTTYNIQLKDHNFKVMAGSDIEYFYSEFQFSQANGLMHPSKPELNLTTGTQTVDGYPSHWSTLGFFGRFNYSYSDKYLFEANIRRDGSSKFPVNHKWGTFPSFSAGYVLSNEKFFAGIQEKIPVSFLKLRASWGSIGNNNVGNYSYLSIMSASNSNWWINAMNPTMVGVFDNVAETLTWETVETLDLGLNAKFFDNALDVEFDYFSRATKDMVTSGVELPVSLGAEPSARNFGVLVTKGWECSVTYEKQFRNELGFSVTALLSDQTGKITKFANEEVSIKTGGNNTPYYKGMTIGEIWGYTTDRLFKESDFSGNNGAANPTWTYGPGTPNQDALNTSSAFHYGPGDVKYKDTNGDGVVDFGAGTNLDHGDMSIIGNTTPRYIYGLKLGLNYKGIDFSAFIQGVGKRDYWGTGSLFIPGFTQAEAVYQNQMDYWTPENEDTYYPAPSNPGANNHNANWQPQTRYLTNMSYLRMKNITIGYMLPPHWLTRTGIRSVRIFASGENLFEIDNLNMTIDPEIQQNSIEGINDAKSYGRTYPYFRTLSCGIQINL